MHAAHVVLMRICVALGFVVWPAVGFGADAGSPGASGMQAGWERLNLGETTLAGTKVYYEKTLEPNLPVFEKELAKFAAGRDRLAGFLARRQEVVADINRILGATDPNTEEQAKILVRFATMFSQIKMTFYLAKMATIKDFLRSGGQLPNFSYDRAGDTALYNPRISVPEGAEPPEKYDFCIPIDPNKEFGEYVAGVFDMLKEFVGPSITCVAIHEVTEFTLLKRARPTDPYWRWFSDGFANAITLDLIEKYMGKDAAKEFDAAYDPNDCRDLENRVNLRYWMLGNYFVYSSETPVTPESKIHYARYTYATVEARRLIAAHGIACVREILDRIAAKDKRDGSDLLQVVKDVTGEDVEQRLARYQTFETRQQGLTKYSEAYKAASRENNYEQMFVNLVRVMELQELGPSFDHLNNFLNAALLLHKMGHEEAADAAMQSAVDLYSKDSVVNGRQAVAEAFVFYALNCDHPQKARKMADEVLKANPEHVPSLVVKMLLSRDESNTTEARKYAADVCRLAEKESRGYRVASEILAIDPNQPPTYKGPGVPK